MVKGTFSGLKIRAGWLMSFEAWLMGCHAAAMLKTGPEKQVEYTRPITTNRTQLVAWEKERVFTKNDDGSHKKNPLGRDEKWPAFLTNDVQYRIHEDGTPTGRATFRIPWGDIQAYKTEVAERQKQMEEEKAKAAAAPATQITATLVTEKGTAPVTVEVQAQKQSKKKK